MKTQFKPATRAVSLAMALVLCFSMLAVPAFAAEEKTPAAGTFVATTQTGENFISLTTPKSFQASIPLEMTEAQAKELAGQVEWRLLPDAGKPYLDAKLFPNQTKGGPLNAWLCADGKTPLFSNLKTSVATKEGKTNLVLTFDSACYFGSDPSVPHSNGGTYMDVCGYFQLSAQQGGKSLGAAPVKITPYDTFHTMAEIYAEMDSMVTYGAQKTNLYVQKFSMGKSQGDNGLEPMDMPYLIVAKNKAAVDNWLALTKKAQTDPAGVLADINSGKLSNYQVPVMYSNVHANEVSASDGVLQFAWMLLKAAGKEGNLEYDTLTGFTAEGKSELAKQMGPAGQEGSLAIPDLVKESASFLGFLKAEGQSVSAPVDLKKFYTTAKQAPQVDDLMDDVFFILVPEENVEGRTYLTRTSSGGLDLNRDNSFQTQAETQNMTHLISTWNPVSYTEFHGRVKAFQCEPCDPPHEPNFEYDLLSKNLMAGGEALGIAAVANNQGYNSYVIPQRDYLTYTGQKAANGQDQTQWLDPWDDMSTSYTPQYAMLHGTAAYTVEVPAYNDHTAKAVAYGQLGQSVYIAENKKSYLLAQTQIFQRGVTNANSNAFDLVGQWFCDQYDVEGAEADLFRPTYDAPGQNGNFYPECYIIPLDGKNQKNLQAASDMMEWLSRNDVKIMLAEKAFTYDGVEYPAGTMVVTMYQAKRSVANGVLYDGTVITQWPVLYSEGITAFNKTRGFDMVTCAEPAAYKTIAAACGSMMDYEACLNYLKKQTSYFTGEKDGKVIIANVSEDSTAAVNTLLQGGKQVGLVLEGAHKGSFICDYADYQSVSTNYMLSATGLNKDLPLSLAITKAPKVYITGKPVDNTSGFVKATLTSGSYQYNYDRQALELMGFQVTTDATQADLIIGAAALDQAAIAAIGKGTPYIGYGANAINSITGSTDKNGKKTPGAVLPEGSLVRQVVSSNSMDALAHVTYPTTSLVNASYVAEGDTILYGYGAGYFETIPQGAQVLVQLDGTKPLLEGFLAGDGAHYKDFLNNSIQGISYQKNGLNLVLFANTLTHKIHQRDEYQFISNAAFANLLGEVYTGQVTNDEQAKALAQAKFTDVSASDWYAASVGQAAAQKLMGGTGQNQFSPAVTTDRAMLVTVLHRMAGAPQATTAGFTDVASGAWYAAGVNWAAEKGVTTGTSANTFAPAAPLTREQAVTMIANYAKSTGAEISSSQSLSGFADASAVAPYAKNAMAWAVETGLVKGDGTNLSPKATATRAELVVLILRANALVSKAQ